MSFKGFKSSLEKEGENSSTIKNFFTKLESKLQSFTDINLRPLTDLFYNPEVLRVDDVYSAGFNPSQN